MQILYETNLPLNTKIVMPYCLYESLEDLQQEAYFGLWQSEYNLENEVVEKVMQENEEQYVTCA